MVKFMCFFSSCCDGCELICRMHWHRVFRGTWSGAESGRFLFGCVTNPDFWASVSLCVFSAADFLETSNPYLPYIYIWNYWLSFFEYANRSGEIIVWYTNKDIKTLLINNGKIWESDIQQYESKAQTLTYLFRKLSIFDVDCVEKQTIVKEGTSLVSGMCRNLNTLSKIQDFRSRYTCSSINFVLAGLQPCRTFQHISLHIHYLAQHLCTCSKAKLVFTTG